MIKNLNNLKRELKSNLDKDRYEHTLGVAYTSICLAMKYEVDLQKAEIAGLLHDCAKCIPDDKKLKKCVEHNISVTEIEREQPHLLHSKLGAFIAMNKYNIHDKDIINAILKHTTGSVDMTILEKIVFVADYIEPGRNKAKNLTNIRKIAFEDIDMAVYIIMKDTIEYLQTKNNKIDKTTLKAFSFYENIINNKN